MAFFADLVGLSAVVGSFFAGVAVAQTPYKQEIDSSIEPIGYAVFIPMFFVSIGLNMTFKGLLTNWLFIVILLVLAFCFAIFTIGLERLLLLLLVIYF